MPEPQANLKQAAVEFLEAAHAVATQPAPGPADPLDGVSTDVFKLGDLQPVISAEELAQLNQDLDQARLLPGTIVQLVSLARQVAETLKQVNYRRGAGLSGPAPPASVELARGASRSLPRHAQEGDTPVTEILKSKKMILSLVGIVAVAALVLAGRDLETVKWVGGFIAGIVASLNLGQRLADGLSEGRTSAAGQGQ